MIRGRRFPPLVNIALIVLALAGIFYASLRYSQSAQQDDNDFLTPWIAANYWMSSGGSPYDPIVRERSLDMSGFEEPQGQRISDRTAFLYPFYSMVFFAPLGLIDFVIARAVWMTLLLVAMVGIVYFSLRLTGFPFRGWELGSFALFALVWYYGARAVMLGQFSVIIVFLMVFSLYLIVQRQDAGAGIVLAFAMARPELALFFALFVVLWSLRSRRSRIATGFFAGLFFLIAISLILKPAWIMDYLRLWLGSAGQDGMISTVLAMVAHTARGIKNPLNIGLHAVVLVYLIFTIIQGIRIQRLFLWSAMLVLVLTSLLTLRMQSTYLVILLPPLFYAYKLIEERVKGGTLITWVITVLAIAVPWVLFFLKFGESGNEPLSLFTVPPLVMLVLLWWTRWWAVRPVKLPFEDLRDRIGS